MEAPAAGPDRQAAAEQQRADVSEGRHGGLGGSGGASVGVRWGSSAGGMPVRGAALVELRSSMLVLRAALVKCCGQACCPRWNDQSESESDVKDVRIGG